jgi:antitoxin CcdA
MTHPLEYDNAARKRPVNLSVNSDLLRQAKSLGINLSQVFDEAIRLKLKKALEEQWLADNEQAIEVFNRHIEKDGIFAADKRRF